MKENSRLWRWILWGVFTAVAILLAVRHEPWYDEYHVWFMCRDMSLPELWRAMTEEGHFIFWHLLIFPFVRLGCSYWCLQAVSVALVSAAAWLLVMRSPFTLPMQVLILFSYPMIYEFPVVARCYALIPLLLFAIATLYRQPGKNLWLYCFLIGLLAHTHVFMEGLVAALFLLYLYEEVYLPWKAGKPVRQRILPAVLIVVLVLLAFIQVTGSLDYGQTHFDNDRRGLMPTVRQLGAGYSLLFSTGMRLHMKDGDFRPILPWLILSVVLLLTLLGMLYRVFWKCRNNRKFALVLLAAIGWQVLFSILIYAFAFQRVYLPMLIVVFCLWCVYEKDLRKESLAVLLLFFLLTVRDTPFSDLKNKLYPDLAIYEEVREKVEPGATIVIASEENPRYSSLLEGSYDVRWLKPGSGQALPNPPYWLVSDNVLSLQK